MFGTALIIAVVIGAFAGIFDGITRNLKSYPFAIKVESVTVSAVYFFEIIYIIHLMLYLMYHSYYRRVTELLVVLGLPLTLMGISYILLCGLMAFFRKEQREIAYRFYRSLLEIFCVTLTSAMYCCFLIRIHCTPQFGEVLRCAILSLPYVAIILWINRTFNLEKAEVKEPEKTEPA